MQGTHGVRDFAGLEFTGERVIPGKTPYAVFQEHLNRYAFAARFIKKKNVLDIACGTGYGTDFLYKNGPKKVVGADISKESIYYSKNSYKDNSFIIADCTKMPFYCDIFDIIISFETIEHIAQYQTYLAECNRILKKNGLFICSTPNKRVFSHRLGENYNHFHVKEFYPEEFHELLSQYFDDIELYGQNNINLIISDIVWNSAKIVSKIPYGNFIKSKIRQRLPKIITENARLSTLSSDNPIDINYKVDNLKSNLFTVPSYIVAISRKKKPVV